MLERKLILFLVSSRQNIWATLTGEADGVHCQKFGSKWKTHVHSTNSKVTVSADQTYIIGRFSFVYSFSDYTTSLVSSSILHKGERKRKNVEGNLQAMNHTFILC